jgi:hypothetical protein
VQTDSIRTAPGSSLSIATLLGSQIPTCQKNHALSIPKPDPFCYPAPSSICQKRRFSDATIHTTDGRREVQVRFKLIRPSCRFIDPISSLYHTVSTVLRRLLNANEHTAILRRSLNNNEMPICGVVICQLINRITANSPPWYRNIPYKAALGATLVLLLLTGIGFAASLGLFLNFPRREPQHPSRQHRRPSGHPV